MAKAVCNGVELSYRSAGEGEDVVLVHGLAANHAFWHVSVLLPLARAYRVTVYDLRGHGHSAMPPGGYTSADLADDLVGLMDCAGIRRAHVVGHSFGGVVALHAAARTPERVSSVTVADSRIRCLQPTQRASDWPNGRAAMERLAAMGLNVPPDEADSGIWLLEQLATPKWRAARDALKGTPLGVPFSSWGGGNRSAERWLELLRTTTARHDFADEAGLTVGRLSAVSCRVLAVYGERSALLPSCRGLERRLECCRSIVVPGAGHFFPATQPGLFVDSVLKFLGEQKKEDCQCKQNRSSQTGFLS